jgi:hypothetical protein
MCSQVEDLSLLAAALPFAPLSKLESAFRTSERLGYFVHVKLWAFNFEATANDVSSR